MISGGTVRGWAVRVAVGVAVVGVLAGCGGGSDDKPAAGPSPLVSVAPSKSVDPDAAEKTALLDVYGAMTAAEVRTYQTAKLDPELSRYATHKALADIQSTLFWYQQKSTLMRGAPTHAPVVNKLVTAGDPLTAEITDCVDSTGYDKVHKDSGKLAAAPSGPRRHVVVSTAQRTRTGQWQIYTSSIERDRTC